VPWMPPRGARQVGFAALAGRLRPAIAQKEIAMLIAAPCLLTLALLLPHSGESESTAKSCDGHCSQANAFSATPSPSSINGRLFMGAVAIGPGSTQPHDAPAAYGAADKADAVVQVSVPGLFGFETGQRTYAISPWHPVTTPSGGNNWSNPYKTGHRKLAARVEAARQQWLKDNNFVGGVRTFVNDSVAGKVPSKAAAEQSPKAIEPRAVIELPPEMPRVRSKVRVLGPDQSPVRTSKATTKVLPKEPVEVAAGPVAKDEGETKASIQ